MKRADWQKVKTSAAKYNNGKPPAFAKDLHLGPLLDTFQAAVKKKDAADIGKNKKAWVVANEAYLDAFKKVTLAAGSYETQLPDLPINAQARKVLGEALRHFLVPLTNDGGKAVRALQAQVARAKQDLAANR